MQDLEQANAFVVSLDAARSWFRYHQIGLRKLELRRAAPGEIAGLHGAAAGWFAGHGYPIEAIRHAQAAQAWDLAARLLADHWPALDLDWAGPPRSTRSWPTSRLTWPGAMSRWSCC